MTKLLSLAACVVCAMTLGGCGTSGSNPILYPEARFQVNPSGESTFRIDALIGGGVTHPSIVGQEFTVTSNFNIVLEGAAPPATGTFTRISGGEIAVLLSVTGLRDVSDATAGAGKSQVTLVNGAPTPPANGAVPVPEVRFDVCAPAANAQSCLTPDDSGRFGIAYTGNIGDSFTTHLLPAPCTISTSDISCSATPTIYFLENARDTVNAIFNGLGQTLIVRLFINGELRQTESGADDIVIREDI